MSYLGIFEMKFEKTIVIIYEINTLEFVKIFLVLKFWSMKARVPVHIINIIHPVVVLTIFLWLSTLYTIRFQLKNYNIMELTALH